MIIRWRLWSQINKTVEKFHKQKVKNLVDNYDKSLKAIEEHRKQVQNGIMLKQEFRKLKEKDVMVTKERNTRLSNGKKNEVIGNDILFYDM